jgi:hypothetical protein
MRGVDTTAKKSNEKDKKKKKKKDWWKRKAMFDIMLAVAFQSVFCLKMYKNNVFLKKYFWH